MQVPETLPETVLEKMHAPPKDASVPVIDVHTLDQADGFVFGFPTRYASSAWYTAVLILCQHHRAPAHQL